MRRCPLVALLLAVILLGGFTYALQAAPALHVSGNTTSPIQISNSTHALDPVIAQASNGKIYIAWRDDGSGLYPYNIYRSVSTNEGRSWSSPLPVASTPGNSGNPSLVISGTLARVAWSDLVSGLDFKIYQADIDEGTPVVVPDVYKRVAYCPSMAAGRDGELHMVFTGKISSEPARVLYTRRPAGAGEWITPTVIYAADGESFNPSLAISADRDKLYLVWSQQVNVTNYYVMYMQGTIGAGGVVTWTEAIAISTPDSHTWRPYIAAAPNGDLHVVWSERDPQAGIYLHYNRYTGGAWQGRVDIGGGIAYEVNQNTPFSLMPAIAINADGSLICVTWNALPSAAAVGEDLFLTCSEDGGTTWSPREQLTDSPSTISTHPAILIDRDQVHLAWQEQTGESATYDYQVFYAHYLGYNVFMPLVLRQAR